MSLLEDLQRAEAKVARLKREVAAGPCREFGHDWQQIGGKNASCHADCACSVPVYTCSKCGDCDYGENTEAEEIRADCAEST